jgi:hypothetical protein
MRYDHVVVIKDGKVCIGFVEEKIPTLVKITCQLSFDPGGRVRNR